MINKLKGNILGSQQETKVTSSKVNEIIDVINSSIVQIGKLIGFNLNSILDQKLTLLGGQRFLITDVVLTNAHDTSNNDLTIVNAGSFGIYDGLGATGNQFCFSNIQGGEKSLSVLVTKQNAVYSGTGRTNSTTRPGLVMNIFSMTCGNVLYASLGTGQGNSATCDIYIYGYILK